MMDLIPKLSSLVVIVLGSIAGTAIIKKIISLAASALAGEAKKLSHVPALVLGYVVSFLFIVVVQAGIIPLPDDLKSSLNAFQTAIMPLITKAIYDTFNDLAKKAKN